MNRKFELQITYNEQGYTIGVYDESLIASANVKVGGDIYGRQIHEAHLFYGYGKELNKQYLAMSDIAGDIVNLTVKHLEASK